MQGSGGPNTEPCEQPRESVVLLSSLTAMQFDRAPDEGWEVLVPELLVDHLPFDIIKTPCDVLPLH